MINKVRILECLAITILLRNSKKVVWRLLDPPLWLQGALSTQGEQNFAQKLKLGKMLFFFFLYNFCFSNLTLTQNNKKLIIRFFWFYFENQRTNHTVILNINLDQDTHIKRTRVRKVLCVFCCQNTYNWWNIG